ncbi:hypothetical protein GDO86_011646 [Hymenochirus boettgeri]|uniref:5-azacytidine-induced protein 2 n=1 Tax=Hymenochirus boettgeri TaxID=247094 RepID=A0A8T2JHW3_9PIPI|nr:hypothetical protein GDO86_011646 [Hymenochirus boettgeri]KAG8442911.1 hypothetical protein GDO86_011646 [Hymenochirus boettgeri]
MDSALDDDICILTHEKADYIQGRDQDIPFSASSGEASVASHFALVTAYEDIKKRLKETEKENHYLKRRLRQMEEKLSGTNEKTASMVEQKLHEICIERDSLLNRLNVEEEKQLECAKNLNDQLQSKEVELLQLRTELETQQVMRTLNKTPSEWEIEKINSDLKMRTVEQELQLLKEECQGLKTELQGTKNLKADTCLLEKDSQELIKERENSMRQAFWELKKEMSNLHLVAEVQAEVLRKLKATKKAFHCGFMTLEEDLKKCDKLQLAAPGVDYIEHNECLATSAPVRTPTNPITFIWKSLTFLSGLKRGLFL